MVFCFFARKNSFLRKKNKDYFTSFSITHLYYAERENNQCKGKKDQNFTIYGKKMFFDAKMMIPSHFLLEHYIYSCRGHRRCSKFLKKGL